MMKRLSLYIGPFVLLLVLLFVAQAQYTGSSAGNSPGGPAGGDNSGMYPNPTVARLNGMPASNYVQVGSAPWLCKPTGGSGTAYVCTPTLLDGAAISSTTLAAPVNGQEMILIPDVNNTGDSTVKIDGATAISVYSKAAPSALASGDLAATYSYLLRYRPAGGRGQVNAWYFDYVGSVAVDSTLTNSGTAVRPSLGVAQPILRGVTGSISGNLTLGTCDTGTATVTGASAAMVALASPTTNPGTGVVWKAYVSAPDTVTVAECGLAIVTPSATTYQVAVIQ